MNNCAIDCWTFITMSVEELCRWLVKNRTWDCWTILPATVDQLCQWLFKNYTSDCWRIVLLTCEESYQPPLNNCASNCWTTVPVTVQQVNALGVMSAQKYLFRVSSYHIKSSQLITIREKLAGFSMVRFLLKCIYEQIVVYVQKCLLVETCALQKLVNWFAM